MFCMPAAITVAGAGGGADAMAAKRGKIVVDVVRGLSGGLLQQGRDGMLLTYACAAKQVSDTV